MVERLSCAYGGIPFPGKDPEESFRFYFRQHWIRLWKPASRLLLWIIIFGVALAAAGLPSIDQDTTRRILVLFFVGVLLIIQFEFLTRFYDFFLYVIVVTDKKVHRFKRTLLTVDEHQTMDLWVVQDIDKVQRGIVQNMLRFGTLSVEAQYTSLKVHFTPEIDEKHASLMLLREEARRRMTPERREEVVKENG